MVTQGNPGDRPSGIFAKKFTPKYSSLPEEVRAGLGCSVVRLRIEAKSYCPAELCDDGDTVFPSGQTLSYLF